MNRQCCLLSPASWPGNVCIMLCYIITVDMFLASSVEDCLNGIISEIIPEIITER